MKSIVNLLLLLTLAFSLGACSQLPKADPTATPPDQELGPTDADVIASLPSMTFSCVWKAAAGSLATAAASTKPSI